MILTVTGMSDNAGIYVDGNVGQDWRDKQGQMKDQREGPK